jgi:hypothetical protein
MIPHFYPRCALLSIDQYRFQELIASSVGSIDAQRNLSATFFRCVISGNEKSHYTCNYVILPSLTRTHEATLR